MGGDAHGDYPKVNYLILTSRRKLSVQQVNAGPILCIREAFFIQETYLAIS